MAPLDELVGGPVRPNAPAAGGGGRTPVRAIVVKPPADPLDVMHVILPGFSQTSYYEVPGDQWAAAGGLPEKDDECLVVFDDENDAWAITAGMGGGAVGPISEVPIEPWHYVGTAGEPAFASGWVNFGGGYANVGYRKTPDGKVQVQGMVKSGIANLVFVLPAGYRPAANVLLPTTANGTGATADINAYIYVEPGGNVYAYPADNTARPFPWDWLSMDGIEFPTDQTTFPTGPAGPPGAPGAGGDKNYVHNQSSPNTIWNVAHGLAKFAAVSVVDSGGSVVIPNVAYVDVNTVQLTFGSATSGKAYVN